MRRRLVIDASVARSAGGVDPDANPARRALEEIRHICHRMVVNPQIEAEWKKHRSVFAQGWLAAMTRRGKVLETGSSSHTRILDQIASLDLPKPHQSAMQKDVHLVAAALETDGIVISQDDKARRQFGALADRIKELTRITWLNPKDPACKRLLRERVKPRATRPPNPVHTPKK